jgi:hypothetical protein
VQSVVRIYKAVKETVITTVVCVFLACLLGSVYLGHLTWLFECVSRQGRVAIHWIGGFYLTHPTAVIVITACAVVVLAVIVAIEVHDRRQQRRERLSPLFATMLSDHAIKAFLEAPKTRAAYLRSSPRIDHP